MKTLFLAKMIALTHEHFTWLDPCSGIAPDAPYAWGIHIFDMTKWHKGKVMLCCGSQEGHWEDIQRTLSEKLWRTWLISQLIWPLAHVVNFAFVPSEQRVLFVNIVSVFWNVVLCQMASGAPRAASFLRGRVSRRPSRIVPLSSIRQES